jgi:phage terminase large subunit GpA-like protein
MSNRYWVEVDWPGGPYAKYERYLRSKEWKRKTWAIWKRAKRCCEHCGGKDNLQVHHLTYEHLYDEPLDDLVLLCKVCHEEADAERKSSQYAVIRSAEDALRAMGRIP